jgi:hypothetical protein
MDPGSWVLGLLTAMVAGSEERPSDILTLQAGARASVGPEDTLVGDGKMLSKVE